ncbi:DNA-lyase [Usnea florida]
MFLKSQRKWENPPMLDDHRDQFKALCCEHKYDAASHVLPHGSYLVNLAQEDAEKATQAYNAFLDDLHRCESLGIKLYNFHPGWTGSHPRPSAIARIAKALNRAHAATRTVIPVLETMAGGGNVIGSTFEDLRDIIALVDDKERVGVCLDTCHVHAAGYDLRKPIAFKKTLDDFDNIVGMKYLCALHLNDSKAPFSSHRDLHQNIGLGFLGLCAFHNVMNEPRFEGLPMVLETPIDHKDEETGKDVEDKRVWAREIKMLEGLIGADVEGDEFKALEKELADKGAEERAKYQEQFERKAEKDKKALEKGQMKLQFGKKKEKGKGVKDGSDSEA